MRNLYDATEVVILHRLPVVVNCMAGAEVLANDGVKGLPMHIRCGECDKKLRQPTHFDELLKLVSPGFFPGGGAPYASAPVR